MKNAKTWNYIGLATIIVAGSLLHFVFSLTDESLIVGLFVPVNESVWEHLKLGYLSCVVFSIIEYPRIGHYVNNYFFSKLAGILALNLTIILVYYLYTAILRSNVLWIDISTYVLGAICCQYIVYRFNTRKQFHELSERLSVAGLIVVGIVFAVFTLYPPHLGIFKEQRTSSYGLQRSSAHD